MHRSVLQWRRHVVLAVLALVLAGCGADSDPGAAPEPAESEINATETKELTQLTIAHLPIAAKVQTVVAQAEGLLAEEGIDANFELFRGDAEAMPAIVADRVDGGGINIATMISAVAEGFELGCFSGGQVIPAEGPDTGNILVAADSDIGSLADLQNRTIAVNNIGSLMWTFAQALLREEGVDASTINFVEVPFPNMGDALQAGEVDAVALVEPFNTVLVNQGLADILSPLYIPVLPGIELDCLIFPMDFYEENEEIVRGYVRAYEGAKEMVMADEELLINHVVEDTGMERNLVEQIVLPEWQPGIDVDRLQDFADLMYEFEVIPRPVDVREFVFEDVAG